MGKGILFCADRLPPLTGGMEMHARFFLSHFTKHPKFPLLKLLQKSIREESIADLPYDPEIVFYNSGKWIEELCEMRNRFPEAFFVYRTGGNEILKAPLERVSLSNHKERQRYWVESINDTIDCLITNSAYTERRLEKIGVKTSFFRSVGGVNISEQIPLTHTRSEETRLFCAARFVPYKNHSLLLSLLSRLVKRGNSLHLRLAGDGPLLEGAKRQVVRENLSSFVTFLGRIENEEVVREIAETDLYIQLSSSMPTEVPGGSYIHAEGMGRSILEAISLGTYVVAGLSGALEEIVGEDRGILLDLEDKDSMIDCLEALIQHLPPKGCIDTSFSWVRVFAHYEQLFKERLCACSS